VKNTTPRTIPTIRLMAMKRTKNCASSKNEHKKQQQQQTRYKYYKYPKKKKKYGLLTRLKSGTI
jgi:hypothetical protein